MVTFSHELSSHSVATSARAKISTGQPFPQRTSPQRFLVLDRIDRQSSVRPMLRYIKPRRFQQAQGKAVAAKTYRSGFPQLLATLSLWHGIVDGYHVATMREMFPVDTKASPTIVQAPQHERDTLLGPTHEAPSLKDREHTYTLTKSKLFKVDKTLLDDVEAAENYLSKSPRARKLFTRLRNAHALVTIRYQKDSDTCSGTGKNTVVHWDNKNYLESHDQENFQAPAPCGINSAALLLQHELDHADWSVSNPIGQMILYLLSHPLYDNLEEARVIRETNKVAAQLNETPRGSHHGKFHAGNGLFDRNDGICNETSTFHQVDDLSRLYGAVDASSFHELAIDPLKIAWMGTVLRDAGARVDDSAVKEVALLVKEHVRIGRSLIDRTSQPHQLPPPDDLHKKYEQHIENAIRVASKFSGIELP